MARIRTVKPEFFRHEGLYEAERSSGLPLRLAFAGLWCCADREGRFSWKPRTLKLDVLPHDDVDFSAILNALGSHGFVVRYETPEGSFGYIPSWRSHQVINLREAQSRLPEPPSCRAGELPAVHVYAHEYVGENIAPALRQRILARDGETCCRCNSEKDLTIDHIFPRSIGGTHAPANLRVMCRPCNSARPVQGTDLLADLAKDGFSMDDMQRTCAHVHACGEGKGREGERKGKKLPDESGVHLKKNSGSKEKPYPEDFEQFWKDYPTDKNMPKKPAFKQWQRLSPDKRAAATAAIPGFRAYCRANDWYRPIYAERFLSQEKFEGYAASAQPARASAFNSPEEQEAQRIAMEAAYGKAAE